MNLKSSIVKFTFLLGITLLSLGSASAQYQVILDDPDAKKNILSAIQHTYNNKPALAKDELKWLNTHYPGNPINDLLPALMLFWKNFPVQSYKAASAAYRVRLENVCTSADKMIANPKTKTEGIFFKLMAKMMLAKYYADMKETMLSIGAAKDAYQLIKQAMVLKKTYPEFYFNTGLYSYYRVYYPESHPAYKPFMSFFMDGDKALGLRELELSAKNSAVCRADAQLFLSRIYLFYENKPREAIGYVKSLVTTYPDNEFYNLLYIECQQMVNPTADNTFYIDNLLASPNEYFTNAGSIYFIIQKNRKGRLSADDKKNLKLAIKNLEMFDGASQGLRAQANACLGNAAAEEGNAKEATIYYKKVIELQRHKPSQDEARKWLKAH